jgi:hypothetical protein
MWYYQREIKMDILNTGVMVVKKIGEIRKLGKSFLLM